MKFNAITIALVIIIMILSVFVANICNLLTVDFDSKDVSENYKRKFKFSKVVDDEIITDSPNHLMWFLQISDIHISIFHDLGRLTDFQDFCDHTVSAIKPSVVLASGDLTDAKQKDSVGSRQYNQEWKNYRKVLDKCESLKETVWLDVRGNHDNFDVPGRDSERNLHRKYSKQGQVTSYKYQLKDKYGDLYNFIALDACPEQGLKRPFNFIGFLSEMEYAHIKHLVINSEANYSIWYGHYPTSCILAPGAQVRKLISDDQTSLAYLCGHLHTLGGLVPKMYTIQKEGFLELELADWKDNRMYRILAIDNGIFSFTDIRHREWPVILITNPKNILFTLPSREPIEKLKTSTHIRILAFSTVPIKWVKVKVDGGLWLSCRHVEGPLYVAPWQPMDFNEGVHYIHAATVDQLNRENKVSHPFSLDGTRESFDLLPRIFLMSSVSAMFQMLFGLAMIGCILPLCFFRYLNSQVKRGKMRTPHYKNKCFHSWIRKFWILANVDKLFYPLSLYPLYLTVGPWCVGELIEGHIGVLFAWGTFINGMYLPGAFTYAYGFLELLLFQGSLIVVAAYRLDFRYHQLKGFSGTRSKAYILTDILRQAPFLALFCLQIGLAYGFWLAYGSMAVIFGPFRIWPLVMTIWCWRQACCISEKELRVAGYVWLKKEDSKCDAALERPMHS